MTYDAAMNILRRVGGEELVERVVQNTGSRDAMRRGKSYIDVRDFLTGAFIFGWSPEGRDYWWGIVEKISQEENNPPIWEEM